MRVAVADVTPIIQLSEFLNQLSYGKLGYVPYVLLARGVVTMPASPHVANNNDNPDNKYFVPPELSCL